ncbi:MAG: hypothetical protein AAF899_03145 [Pseudomonadota bacterium]
MQRYIIMALSGMLMTGCATNAPETQPTANALPPAPVPEVVIGPYAEIQWADGSLDVLQISKSDGNLLSGSFESGCKWTAFSDGYGPSPSWEDCWGSTGTNKLTREGVLFPLEIGKSERWEVEGRNTDGGTWKTVRRCEVAETVSVTVPAGTYDTYHVKCSDSWRSYSWYYSPELGHSVASVNTHRSDPTRSRSWQLVKSLKNTSSEVPASG